MPEQYYRVIDLSDIVKTGESSEPVQYVGCYVLRWGKDQHPEVGFRPVDDPVFRSASKINEALIPFARAFEAATENEEDWFGALDRVGLDDFMAALDAVVFPDEEEE